ncbi:hypothetical protein J4211_04620 [Candidatus Woesearchaeota archaeon]|nr:hypothetical protein [Candidatus Woesearchaeota archaeon]
MKNEIEKSAALFIAVLGIFALVIAVDTLTGSAIVQVANFTVGVDTFLACVWSSSSLNISFGTDLSPGVAFYNASDNYGVGNATGYNVTVDQISNINVNVTVKGEPLISGTNSIGIGNVTWQSNVSDANGSNLVQGGSIPLTSSFNVVNPVASALAPAGVVHFRVWMSVPGGQVAGSYAGNYTMQCVQE